MADKESAQVSCRESPSMSIPVRDVGGCGAAREGPAGLKQRQGEDRD